MYYLETIKAIWMLDEAIYREIMQAGKTVSYCVLNIFAFGALHALFFLLFSNLLFAAEVPLLEKMFFLTIGVGTSFLLHAGVALFIWVFVRAAGGGGKIPFFPIYFNLGIALAGAWPMAPVLSAVQAGWAGVWGGGMLLYGLLAITALFALAVFFCAAKSASQLSMARMLAAFAGTILVVTSLLYLWV